MACPNDYGALKIFDNKLVCKSCNAEFRIIDENTVNLVPHNEENLVTPQSKDVYSKIYFDLRNIGRPTNPRARRWGLESKSIPLGFVTKLRETILRIIDDSIICDVGAGAGDYSLVLAKKSKLVFHCDLDLEAINAAKAKAKKLNLNNIIFVISDYFSLPFHHNSLPCITCIDVLERGKEHDMKLFEQMSQKLKPKGTLIADFHSKERTKLTHASNLETRYSRNELLTIFPKFNFKIFKIKGTGYFPQIGIQSILIYKICDTISKIIFPPARWLVSATKISE